MFHGSLGLRASDTYEITSVHVEPYLAFIFVGVLGSRNFEMQRYDSPSLSWTTITEKAPKRYSVFDDGVTIGVTPEVDMRIAYTG